MLPCRALILRYATLIRDAYLLADDGRRHYADIFRHDRYAATCHTPCHLFEYTPPFY